jgi:hypothetical protein
VYPPGGHAFSKCAPLDFIYIDLGDHLLYVEIYSGEEKHTVDISSR